MASVGLGQSSQASLRGLPLDFHIFPYDQQTSAELPVVDFPGVIVVAPREEELDVTWNSADYARALPRLCSADLLGLAIEGIQGTNVACTLQLATEDTCILWRVFNSTKLPYDLDLLLSGPIPKVGRDVLKLLHSLEMVYKLRVCNYSDLDLSTSLAGLDNSRVDPCAAFLGFSIRQPAVFCDWRAAVLSDMQLRLAATKAWTSLLACRSLLREDRGATLLQAYPFLHSTRELSTFKEQERRASLSSTHSLEDALRVVKLVLVPGVKIARAKRLPSVRAGQNSKVLSNDLDSGLTAAGIRPDLWTLTHEWSRSDRDRQLAPFVLHTASTVVTLVGQFVKDEAWVIHARSGLVSSHQVEASTEDGDRNEFVANYQRHWRHQGRALSELIDRMYSYSLKTFSQTKVTSTMMFPVGNGLCDVAVSRALSEVTAELSRRHDSVRSHLKLHTRRLREFMRAALRSNVEPFLLVTATTAACGCDSSEVKECTKRPVTVPFSHEEVVEKHFHNQQDYSRKD